MRNGGQRHCRSEGSYYLALLNITKDEIVLHFAINEEREHWEIICFIWFIWEGLSTWFRLTWRRSSKLGICERKWSWPGFKHVAEVFMEVLRQTNEIVGQDNRDLKPRLPKYETGALWTLSRTDDGAVCSDVGMYDAVKALKLLASLTVPDINETPISLDQLFKYGRSQWPRVLRRRSTAARQLRLWVRIPPGTWMFVCCECCVLSGRGLCDELITRPEESYRLWCVVVCDLETSWMRRSWPTEGCRSKTKLCKCYSKMLRMKYKYISYVYMYIYSYDSTM